MKIETITQLGELLAATRQQRGVSYASMAPKGVCYDVARNIENAVGRGGTFDSVMAFANCVGLQFCLVNERNPLPKRTGARGRPFKDMPSTTDSSRKSASDPLPPRPVSNLTPIRSTPINCREAMVSFMQRMQNTNGVIANLPQSYGFCNNFMTRLESSVKGVYLDSLLRYLHVIGVSLEAEAGDIPE